MNVTRNEIVTIENNIYSSINQCLEDGEIIVPSQHFDFHVPKGSKILNWPPNTYIEIKYKLIFDTIDKIKNSFDHTDAEKLIVVVLAEGNYMDKIFRANNTITGRNIDVVTYEKFINSLPVAKEKKGLDKLSKTIDSYSINKEKNIKEKAKEVIKHNRICLFLGAGVSASAGVVTWDSLLEQLCVKKGLPKIDSDIDGIIKGRFIIDTYKTQQKKNPDEFYDDMRNILYANIHSSELIDAIACFITKSNVESVITYNYDDLVEQKVNEAKKCYSIYDKSRPTEGNAVQIYHVHGFIPQKGVWSPIVLGEKEYHKIYQEAYNWGNVEQLHALCRNVCFFIGLSMKDPNLRRLIDISIDGSEIEPVHYAFLRKIEHNVPFMEMIMRGFGVNCIWYDTFEDLPKIINELIK